MSADLIEEQPAPRGHLAAEALGSLATRASFLVVAWLLLTGSGTVAQVTIVVAGQVLAYVLGSVLGVWLVGRTNPVVVAVSTDLLSAAAMASAAFVYTDLRWLGAAAAGVAVLRALSDRAKNAYRPGPAPVFDEAAAPPRVVLIRVLLLVLGALTGAAAAGLGPSGALWATAMAFAASAGLTVWASTEPTSTTVEGEKTAELWRDGLLRRLGVVLFASNLLAQAAAVLLVVVWLRDPLPQAAAGYAAGAFILGMLCGGLLLNSLIRHPSAVLALAVGYLVGGGAMAIRAGVQATLLLIVGVALLAGIAFASVTPAMGTMLSQLVPPAARARVGGVAAAVAYLGIPLGTLGGALLLDRFDSLILGIAAGGGLLAVAMLVPVSAYRSWGLLNAEVPSPVTMLGAPRLPARLTVTLAYANGEWLIEVRKGRALLGKRHLVKSAEALSMLSMLDVPGVHARVEQALTVDQTEATRQVERMRSELAEMEAKLAGLNEMVELTDSRAPARQVEEAAKTAST